jgi:hypothetical protein
MATINGKSYQTPRNINLKGGTTGSGLIRWDPNVANWTLNPFSSTDYGLYLNAAGELVFSKKGTTVILGAAGVGGGVASSWDQIYAGDQTLAIPGATLTFDGTHASNDVVTITSTGAGSGDLLQITNVGTGKDINGTGNTWSFTKDGINVMKSTTIAGTGGANSIVLTAGDILASDGSLTIIDADDAATLSITNNTAASASMIVFAGSGTFTGNTTSSFMTLTASGLTTGTVLYIPVAALTTGKGINIIGTTALTTGQMVNIESGTTGTSLTGNGRLLRIAHTGTATSSGILAEITSAATDETVIFQITASAALAAGNALKLSTASVTTGTLINALGAALTTGSVLSCVDLAGLTTGHGIILTHATSVITTGSLFELNSSGVNTGSGGDGTMINVDSTGQLAGSLVTVDTILTTGTAMSIISTGIMTTTGNLLTLTANSATTAAGLLRVNGNGLTSGIGVVITSSATAITGAGRLLRVDHTGATGTSAVLSEFASAANDESTILRITASDVLAAGVALDISASAMTTGTALDIGGMAAITTGNGIVVAASGTTRTDGMLLSLTCASTAATATGRMLLVNHTGATGTSTVLAEIKTAATDETVIFQVLASAALAAGKAVNVSVAAMTTGTALSIANADALTTGSIANFTSNSANAGARDLVYIKNDHASAVLTKPITIVNDAVTGTGSKFKNAGNFCGYNIWVSIDGTSPHGVLGADQNANVATGDICLGTTGGKIAYCTNHATNGTWAILT